jgi:hypothetical protein
MRTKLKLNLDDLSVDSFDTSRSEKPKGTVFGEQCTCWTQCAQNTCPGCPTCDATCAGSCAATCAYTCDDATCAGCQTAGVSCYNTDCGCNPATCLNTNCGRYLCCA